MRERSRTLKIKAAKRDDFTCQKCKFQDKTGEKLEVHHIIPLYMGGKDELENIFTLCFDCHHHSPDKPEEFKEYMGEEMEGTLTNLIKAWKLVRKEHPELFEEDSFSKMENKDIEKLRKENEELKQEIEKLRALKENQKQGMNKKASQGSPVSRAPFGYRMEGKGLVPSENAYLVEEIFQDFLNQKISLTQLAKKYQLSVNGLKKILTNFTYIGKVKFDGQTHQGTHQPLISSTLFNHVQNKLEKLGIKPISK